LTNMQKSVARFNCKQLKRALQLGNKFPIGGDQI